MRSLHVVHMHIVRTCEHHDAQYGMHNPRMHAVFLALWCTSDAVQANRTKWCPLATPFTVGGRAAAVRLNNGLVLVCGGYQLLGNAAFDTSTCYLFDAVTGNWTPTGSMNTERASFSSLSLADGRVLVWGGNSAEVYSAGRWTTIAPLPAQQGSYSAASAALPDGRVFIMARNASNSVVCFLSDVALAQWSPCSPPPDWVTRSSVFFGPAT